MTSNGTAITIPLTALTGLTAGEADPDTGDGRKVAYEITRAIVEKVTALPTADRPNRMTVTTGTLQGISATVARRGYTLSYDLDITGSDVAPEA
jgi:hypothetical protein